MFKEVELSQKTDYKVRICEEWVRSWYNDSIFKQQGHSLNSLFGDERCAADEVSAFYSLINHLDFWCKARWRRSNQSHDGLTFFDLDYEFESPSGSFTIRVKHINYQFFLIPERPFNDLDSFLSWINGLEDTIHRIAKGV